ESERSLRVFHGHSLRRCSKQLTRPSGAFARQDRTVRPGGSCESVHTLREQACQPVQMLAVVCGLARSVLELEEGHCTPVVISSSLQPPSYGLFNHTTSIQPFCISSQVCRPQRTSFDGSGFRGLSAELSQRPVQVSFVPLGIFSGSVKRYTLCQL